jgi:NitT/TauT family transport system ATP-binding protein
VTGDADIVIEGLSKTFRVERTGRLVTALDNIDLEIRHGEFLCLVGPSGCGKSTLLQLLAGLQPATAGAITLNGRRVSRPGAERGMVFQSYALFPWRTVLRNIEFGLEIKGMAKSARHRVALDYARLVGLDGFEHAYPAELSGGMKQRVGIARALANDPEVLLMDEPFASLDAQTRELMQQEVLEIWRKTGRTVVFVTHSVQEAVYLADRIAVMTARPGRIKDLIEVGLPRPRDVTSADFGQLMRPVYAALKEEVMKTHGVRYDGATGAESEA